MTDAEKLTMLKSLLNITDTSQDIQLGVYLSLSKKEVINWRYSATSKPNIAKAADSELNLVSVYVPLFIAKLSPVRGTSYVFAYSEVDVSWQYSGSDVELDDYGIGYSAEPIDAETITVKYNENYLAEYEPTQVMACVAGFSLSGAENETDHSENSVIRKFKYSDMLDYIHAHVLPFVGVL